MEAYVLNKEGVPIMTNLRSILGFIAILTLLAMPHYSVAGKHQRNYNVGIEIISDWRGHLDLIRGPSRGLKQNNKFLIVKHDEPYRIRVTNYGNSRVAVVIAVDGVNVLSGRPTDLKFHERMAVLEPNQIQEFEGVQQGRHHRKGFYLIQKNVFMAITGVDLLVWELLHLQYLMRSSNAQTGTDQGNGEIIEGQIGHREQTYILHQGKRQ